MSFHIAYSFLCCAKASKFNQVPLVYFCFYFHYSKDLPGGSDGKLSVYNAGDLGSFPGWGRSFGEGNGNPLHYSCLENPMDRGAKSWIGLSDFTSTFILSFAVQKNLIMSHLFHFVFIFISLGGGSLRILLWFMSPSVLPMFSSKSFIVSGLKFRSLIHFEFIFMYGVRKCYNFILLHVALQFSQHYLLKRLFLPHCIFLPPLSKIRHP